MGGDAFVAKLNPAGNALVYCTFIGGSLDDVATAIAIDTAGNAYITGGTISTNFPTTPGAYQRTFKGGGGNPDLCSGCGPTLVGGDAWVAKLSSDGSRLIFSTYLSGSLNDATTAIALDSAGDVFVGGYTVSSDFPTSPGAFQRALKGIASDQIMYRLGDGFVTKLTPDGAQLVFSTYLGGSRMTP